MRKDFGLKNEILTIIIRKANYIFEKQTVEECNNKKSVT